MRRPCFRGDKRADGPGGQRGGKDFRGVAGGADGGDAPATGKVYARCELPDGIYSYSVTHPHHEDYMGTVTIDSTGKDSHTEQVQMQRRRLRLILP